ncbi:DSD1 family PLP-dependent enzyme [Agrobacterium larrymoorei]|uniref:DSD1 family PLP-dependent enzyme n=1 Tax=Agrobacterium larrymoorei TaxID=160699 RepID=A0AAF0KG71_9HYPH|nr:DSD1 family PLP-dependent enzyme [Agrobacterium larrymoorei]WHA43886.1 DSD1 family PLP-dependent enzyme [Agrobacterium larrymoorei]
MKPNYLPLQKSQCPNFDLLNVPGGAKLLDTPALVIDVDILQRNIKNMARWAQGKNIALRPHAKTHKSAAIAKQQLASGALGICVAKIGEAIRLAEEGVGNILITSPIVTDRKIRLLRDLNEKCEHLMVAVDNVEIVKLLDLAFSGGKSLDVLIDRGMGIGYHNRTGAFTAEAAVELADTISRCSNLNLRGLQAYSGAVQHVEAFEERKVIALEAIDRIRKTRDALLERGHDIEIVTGGGTGSCEFDALSGVFTELQVGSYVFFDVEYNAVIHGADFPQDLQTALFLQTSVISANLFGRATTDAGFKSFATDGPLPIIHSGAAEGSRYVFMGDEQGGVIAGEGEAGLAVGDVVRCVTPHCDPTVNLHDFYHCIRGDMLVDIWPVHSRGQSW